MVFNKRENLTILKLDEDTKRVSFDQLGKILFYRPSNVIYCEKEGKLYGIISTGDIHRAREEKHDYVQVNNNYTFLVGYKYMKARRIFMEKNNINSLPIVDEEDRILGDYVRWDDIYGGYKFSFISGNEYADKCWEKYKKVAIVKPSSASEVKQKLVEVWIDLLNSLGIENRIIEKLDIIKAFNDVEKILFIDEDEIRGLGTLFKDILCEDFIWERASTLKNLEDEIRKSIKINREIEYAEALREDYGESVLNEIIESGVNIVTLHMKMENTTYWKRIDNHIYAKYESIGANRNINDDHEEFWVEFYDDIYSYTDALEFGTQKYQQCIENGVIKLKDYESKNYNVINGERCTTKQPEKYDNTIYFFGACFILGFKVKDECTLESRLQDILNKEGKRWRVVNCGCFSNIQNLLIRVCSTKFKKGDIAIIYYRGTYFKGIPSIDLSKVLENNNVPANCFWNHPLHANHKVHQLWAQEIYKEITDFLYCNKTDDFIDYKEMKYALMTKTYIDQYFYDFKNDCEVGAIVMNCNPFTDGHMYLIEKARSMCDKLIIFVVEEDKSLFSFSERFAMVTEAVEKLRNVVVVPSGEYILSQKTFPEYFAKVDDKDIIKNAEFDIEIFAMGIARRLGIKYRFVGEEINDTVTAEYNNAMKRILPEYGIKLVEIPRKLGKDGNPISATIVRRFLEKCDIEELNKLVPQSTINILMGS